MLSYPIDSTLQLMNQQLDILACLRASAHNLKSDFSLSFSFSITGVVIHTALDIGSLCHIGSV